MKSSSDKGHLIVSLILEHAPGWIIDGSRRKCIQYAITEKDVEFLMLLTQTTVPFLHSADYLELAAGIENNIPIMEFLIASSCPIDHLQTLTSAIKNRALNNLKWLVKHGFHLDNPRFVEIAASIEDNIPILEYLVAKKCPVNLISTLVPAAKKGALNNLIWFKNRGFPIDNSKIFAAAIDSGSFDMMEWLLQNGCPICPWTFSFIEKCSLETLQWLKEQGLKIQQCPCIVAGAAMRGCIDTLQWLFDSRCSFKNPMVFAAAAQSGSLDTMKWLLKKGCSIKDSQILKEAAGHGSLENMSWILSKGCPINDSKIFIEAAKHADLDIMNWLLRNRCPINDSEIFAAAAETGSIEQMVWLLQHGCPIKDASIFKAAVRHGNIPVMEWLLEHKCPINSTSILEGAARNGNLQSIKWLVENGCPTNSVWILVEAVRNGSLYNMRWLRDIGCPIDNSIIFCTAARQGSIINMQWLLKNGCPVKDPRIFDAAASFGSLRNMRWLLENGCPASRKYSNKNLAQLLQIDESMIHYQ